MTGVQPMPCPVLLGTVKGGGLSALLHRNTIEKKVSKVENVLKKGAQENSPKVCADCFDAALVLYL
uniref:Uncharacterized protein n=1 Tax=Cyprinus carpio carpio TaxID=630221 RepID=A0A8C1FL29_CYPCA